MQVECQRFVEGAVCVVSASCRQPDLTLRLGQRRLVRILATRGRMPFWQRHCGHGIVRRGSCRSCRRQHAATAHLLDRLAKAFDYERKILIGMRGGEKARVALQDVNALLAHVVIKQAAEARLRGQAEGKPRAARMHTHINSSIAETRFHGARGQGNFLAQRFLQLRPCFLQVMQDRLRRRQRNRMAHKRSGKESHSNLWS